MGVVKSPLRRSCLLGEFQKRTYSFGQTFEQYACLSVLIYFDFCVCVPAIVRTEPRKPKQEQGAADQPPFGIPRPLVPKRGVGEGGSSSARRPDVDKRIPAGEECG